MKELHRRIRLARQREGGFTLIELLIVIVILGVLAAVVILSVSGITNKGAVSACKADVKSIDTAAEAYYAQNGTGAASMNALVSGGFLHADTTISTNGLSKVTSNYTLTFTPGGGSSAGNADTSTLTGCP